MIPQSKTIYLTSLIPEFHQTRFLSNVHLHLNLTLFNRITENVIGNAEKITGGGIAIPYYAFFSLLLNLTTYGCTAEMIL